MSSVSLAAPRGGARRDRRRATSDDLEGGRSGSEGSIPCPCRDRGHARYPQTRGHVCTRSTSRSPIARPSPPAREVRATRRAIHPRLDRLQRVRHSGDRLIPTRAEWAGRAALPSVRRARRSASPMTRDSACRQSLDIARRHEQPGVGADESRNRTGRRAHDGQTVRERLGDGHAVGFAQASPARRHPIGRNCSSSALGVELADERDVIVQLQLSNDALESVQPSADVASDFRRTSGASRETALQRAPSSNSSCPLPGLSVATDSN